MGLWQIDTDTLARSRFVLSPFAEAFASLRLRVLLDAGMVERRRAGRSVLYVRTAAGEVLMDASGSRTGGQESEPGIHQVSDRSRT
ncbi:hypothetical protein [Streptomyces sp. LN245]|uniref:hypothetical protein n=1 Tax=Streptomyces sp. LN245 TaxID=3112975 RepID=UPI0037117403